MQHSIDNSITIFGISCCFIIGLVSKYVVGNVDFIIEQEKEIRDAIACNSNIITQKKSTKKSMICL